MGGKKNQEGIGPRETWLKSLKLSEGDYARGLRLEAGEGMEREIGAKSNPIMYFIDPYGLSDLSNDPDSYQKLIDDIDATIKKNIAE